MVNAGHVVGTRGSGIVSSVTEVLWLSLVRVMRGVSGVCAQYFFIASCGSMPRDNGCMYMSHVCFYVICSDCVGVRGHVCCVAVVVFLALECLNMLCVCVVDV